MHQSQRDFFIQKRAKIYQLKAPFKEKPRGEQAQLLACIALSQTPLLPPFKPALLTQPSCARWAAVGAVTAMWSISFLSLSVIPPALSQLWGNSSCQNPTNTLVSLAWERVDWFVVSLPSIQHKFFPQSPIKQGNQRPMGAAI